MMTARTRDLFILIFLRVRMRKQFPEIVSTGVKSVETEPKALELFCAQPTIIAFSLIYEEHAYRKLAFVGCTTS
jgi:hypothetical protein